jgi:hypothetical protein
MPLSLRFLDLLVAPVMFPVDVRRCAEALVALGVPVLALVVTVEFLGIEPLYLVLCIELTDL